MTYRVDITKKAAKQIAKLPRQIQSRVLTTIEALADEPRPSGAKKLSGRDDYRVRVSDYRIIYTIEDQTLTVEVVKVAHRRDVHEG